MNKNILLINWGTRDKEYPFKIAQKKGLNIFLATSKNYPEWVEEYVPINQLIFTNTYNSEKLLIDVLAFIHKHKIKFDAITTFFEMNIIQTADLASALGHKFVSPAGARKSSGNKLLMKMACQEQGIRVPKFFVFNKLKQGFSYLKKFKGSVVLKPVKSGHSFGSIKINKSGRGLTKKEFGRLFLKAKKHLDSSLDEWMDFWQPYKQDYLIEEYVKGPVISVDGLVQEGKVIICGLSEFIMGPEPFFVQEGVFIPAKVSALVRKKCLNQAEKIIKALEFDNCGFHCEMKWTKKELVLLEIAARPPGGDMLEGYNQAYGVDFAGLYLDICLGKKIDYSYKKNKKFVLQYTVFPRRKRLVVKTIKGFDRIKKLKSFIRGGISTPVNHPVSFQGDFPQDTLYYHLCTKSQRQLTKDQKLIQKVLKVNYSANIIWYCFKRGQRLIKELLKKLLNITKEVIW